MLSREKTPSRAFRSFWKLLCGSIVNQGFRTVHNRSNDLMDLAVLGRVGGSKPCT